MSPAVRNCWTERYRGKETALLVEGGNVEEVPIIRVLKSLVIVERAGEEMRYAQDSLSGRGWIATLREKNGAVSRAQCPMLALEGDRIVGLVRQEVAEKAKREKRSGILRRRIASALERADPDALERVALALEQPRRKVDVSGEWRDLADLFGGEQASLARGQAEALARLRRALRRRVAEARKSGFEQGQNLLCGLNSGKYTPETFADRLRHAQYHVDLEAERSRPSPGGE